MRLSKAPKEFSLEDAVWKFATPSMRQQFERANRLAIPQVKSDQEMDMNEALSGLQSLFERWSKRAKSHSGMKVGKLKTKRAKNPAPKPQIGDLSLPHIPQDGGLGASLAARFG
jgi:hypothetical protein